MLLLLLAASGLRLAALTQHLVLLLPQVEVASFEGLIDVCVCVCIVLKVNIALCDLHLEERIRGCDY